MASSTGGTKLVAGREMSTRHMPAGVPAIPIRTRWRPPTPEVVEPDTTDEQNHDKENTE